MAEYERRLDFVRSHLAMLPVVNLLNSLSKVRSVIEHDHSRLSHISRSRQRVRQHREKFVVEVLVWFRMQKCGRFLERRKDCPGASQQMQVKFRKDKPTCEDFSEIIMAADPVCSIKTT